MAPPLSHPFARSRRQTPAVTRSDDVTTSREMTKGEETIPRSMEAGRNGICLILKKGNASDGDSSKPKVGRANPSRKGWVPVDSEGSSGRERGGFLYVIPPPRRDLVFGPSIPSSCPVERVKGSAARVKKFFVVFTVIVPPTLSLWSSSFSAP